MANKQARLAKIEKPRPSWRRARGKAAADTARGSAATAQPPRATRALTVPRLTYPLPRRVARRVIAPLTQVKAKSLDI